MTHRVSSAYRRAWSLAALLALTALLAACGEQAPPINPDNAVSITRTDGAATLARAPDNSKGDLPDNVLLTPGDQLYTAPDRTVTLQFSDGSTLHVGPDSHLVLFFIRPTERVAIFRLLAGSAKGDLRSNAFELQGYEEVAIKFNMVATDLAAIPRGVPGTYQLEFDGNQLKAVVHSGEFDIRSGDRQATLPSGWQAIAVPGKTLQIVALFTPTPAAAGVPTVTPIQIITITPTNTPTETPTPTLTATATATHTPTRTPTRVPRPISSSTLTPTASVPTDTPIPTPTDRPEPPPQPTKPPPTNPPPTNPPPTDPPPTDTPPPPPTDTPPPPTELPTIPASG